MKKLIGGLVILGMLGILLPAAAADKSAAGSKKPPPGVAAATTISTVTGVAISPLLGVSTVGAYKYFSAEKKERSSLPWYAQPWFWAPGLLVALLAILKDVLGAAAPTALKKPMDVAETIENKISGLVAAGAFVPLVTEIFPHATGLGSTAMLGPLGFASVDLASVANVLMVPFTVAVFVIVWLAAHAINVLILVSPFTTVDLALKSVRAAVLSMVAVTHWINPYIGALLSLLLIIFCYLVAGWAFRLLVLGSVFVWDFFTLRRRRFQPAPNANWMFTARRIADVPIRTYGRLIKDDQGRLTFEYRPWLFLPRRVLAMPEGKYAVGRGLFYPAIMTLAKDNEGQTLFLLPPRYRTHEEQLGQAYGMAVQDIGLLKGLKAVWKWIRQLFGFKAETIPATI